MHESAPSRVQERAAEILRPFFLLNLLLCELIENQKTYLR